MSSCCLAACGRLAENSQPGEAAFNSLWTGSPGTSAPSAGSHGRGGPCGVLGLWFWRVWGGSGVRLPQKCFRVPLPEPCPQHKGKGRHAGSEPFPPHPRPSLGPADTAPAAAVPRTHSWLRDRTECPAAHLPWAETYPDKKKVAVRVWCLGTLSCLQGAAAPGPPAPLYDSGCPSGCCLWAGRGVRDVWRAPGGPRAQGAAAQSQQRNKACKIVFHNHTGRLAQEAWRWVQVGRHEVCGPLPTPLTQLRCCRSLILLLSHLWALPWSLLPGPGAFSAAPRGC